MQINWFTVIAQILNFLLLVWLLKKFLYKPVLDAISDREKKIAGQQDEAKTKMAIAESSKNEYMKKNEVFENERISKMNQLMEETKAEKERLFEEAKKSSELFQSKLTASMMYQQQQLLSEWETQVQHEVFAIASKTLSDLASTDLETQTVNKFIQRLHSLPKAETQKLKDAFFSNEKNMIVKSAFDLSLGQRDQLENAIKQMVESDINFQYKTLPKMISGIEVSSNGYKLSWNLGSYLSSMEKNLIGTTFSPNPKN